MNKTLAILGMVAVLFGATLHANALISASATDVSGTTNRHMTPPSLSLTAPKAPVTVRTGVASPSRVTLGGSFSWSSITANPNATDRIVSATVYDPVNDHIYMMGGNPAGNTGTYVTNNDMYDPTAGTWASKAALPTALGWEPGAYCRGNIYYLGGHNNSNTVATTNYKYSISGDSWHSGTAVPRARLADMEVTWHDSLIYCLGGWDGASSIGLTTVDIYDPFADAWLTGTALPTDMDMGGAGIIGDTIYIVSAVNRSLGTALANLYKGYIDPTNPTSITWIQGPAFGSPTCITGATALGTKVYWFGGFVNATTPTNAGWYYDNTTGTITSFTPYMGTISRNQWLCARPMGGPTSEIYGMAGDSNCDWTTPNRGYCKLTVANAVMSVDVGVTAITEPGPHFTPGTPVTPACVVENFGSDPQSNIPVTCWIDSAGNHVYSQNAMIPGPLAPDSTAAVSFSPDWTPGNNSYYEVTMFTSLSGDGMPSNDTMKLATTQGWTAITPNPEGTDRIVSATVYDPVNDHIYMIGGNPAGNTGTYLAYNDMYDPTAGTWASKTQMPESLGWEPGAYCRGNIYYLGGHNNASVVVTTNNIYNIGTDAWSTGTAVPRGRLADMEVTWRDSLIYCLGGWDGASSSGLTTVDIYDPFADAWLTGTALPTDMDMGGAGIIGDTIYIVSAVNRSLGTALANLYKGYIDPTNPTSITWIMGPAFGSPTCITGATVLGPRVYWFGGFVNATAPTNAGWYYDNTTGTITSFTPYMGTISRNQWVCGRPMSGAVSELYGMAGDSACDWTTPNEGYYKLTIPNPVVGVSETKPVMNIVPAGILSAAEPNPFHGRTLVNYSLAKAGDVSLKLYDVTGQLVLTVTNGFVTAGSHTEAIDASKLAHGMYLLRLNTGTTTSIAKLILE